MADSEADSKAPFRIIVRTIFQVDGYVAEREITGTEEQVIISCALVSQELTWNIRIRHICNGEGSHPVRRTILSCPEDNFVAKLEKITM